MIDNRIKKILKWGGILMILIIILIAIGFFVFSIYAVFSMMSYPEHHLHEAYKFAKTDPDRAIFACEKISDFLHADAKDKCYSEIANAVMDENIILSEKICEKIRSADEQNFCLARAKLKSNNTKEAMNFCKKIKSDSDMGWCLTQTMELLIETAMNKNNIADAIAICDDLKDGWIQGQCYGKIARDFAENNTEYAIEICNKATWKGIMDDARKSCYDDILHEISKNDPEKALNLCKELLDNGECYSFKVKLVREHPNKSQQEICSSLSSQMERDSCYLQAAEIIANKDLERAVEICNKFVSPNERDYCIGMIGRSLNISESNFTNSDILNVADMCGDDTGYVICYSAFVPIIAEFDTEKALDICEKLNPEPYESAVCFCYKDIANIVMKTDYKQAKEICDKIKPYDTSFDDFCYNDIAFHLINKSYENLNISLEICSEVESDYSKEDCYSEVGIQIIKIDPYEAINICESINSTQTSSIKQDCLHKASVVLSKSNPDDAISTCNKIEDLHFDSQYRDWCYRDVAMGIDEINPDESITVCEKIKNSKIKDLCIGEVKSDYRLFEDN